VVIHSKGRAGDSRFITELLNVEAPALFLFVEPQEEAKYRAAYPSARLVVIDKNDQGLQYVQEKEREYALKEGWEWFWMCDDDPKGFRKTDGNGKRVRTSALDAMLFCQQLKGEGVGMVGMARASTNFPGGPEVLENKGVEWIRGLSREACQAARFRLPHLMDVDFPLQVLASGLRTRRTTLRDVDLPPDGSNKGGMFEVYKKKEILQGAMKRLEELWPGVVSVRNGKLHRRWARAFKPRSSIEGLLCFGRKVLVQEIRAAPRAGESGKVFLATEHGEKEADTLLDLGPSSPKILREKWRREA
jgi:hypothetical protein